MKKIRYVKTSYIAKTVRLNHLKNIIIETGTENAFYPEENRFVLSKDNSYIVSNLLSECSKLERVDLTNFDFTETVSMSGWFYHCYSLKEIIFPKNVVCKNLCNILKCFYGNPIRKIDFSSWIFECPIEMEEFIVNCTLLKSVKLPEMKVKYASKFIKSCENLETIEAPIEATRTAPISRLVGSCQSLKVLDFSKAKLDSTKSNKEVLLSDGNIYNIPDDCVILVE